MNIKRWIYNLRHLNLMENNFATRIETIDAEKNQLKEMVSSQLNLMQENNKDTFKSLMLENEKLKDMIYRLKSTLQEKEIIPIKVVFLCEKKELWKSFSSLVEKLFEDSRFEVIVVNLWCKDYSSDGSYSYVSPQIEDVCKKMEI